MFFLHYYITFNFYKYLISLILLENYGCLFLQSMLIICPLIQVVINKYTIKVENEICISKSKLFQTNWPASVNCIFLRSNKLSCTKAFLNVSINFGCPTFKVRSIHTNLISKDENLNLISICNISIFLHLNSYIII